jgi:ribosome-binding factor A
MPLYKPQKTESAMMELAAEFISREAGPGSLITVTGAQISTRSNATRILVTVFPETKEAAALDFLGRKKREFGEYLATRAKMRRLPTVSFAIDLGEKNRQVVDDISREEAAREQARAAASEHQDSNTESREQARREKTA